MHVPIRPSQTVQLAVRTTTPAAAALPMLRAAVLGVEPAVVFSGDTTATDVVATTVAPTRIGAGLLGAFGALALLLAAVGLYGVVAYSVSLRTREVGVRMALGARRGDVLRLVLGQAGRLSVVGIAAGAALAALVARVLDSLLYGVSALDPAAYAIPAVVLLTVVALASLGPALTAAGVDPLRALRSE
jgi:ABC-type antimicrobial peptide transport system permease subunit